MDRAVVTRTVKFERSAKKSFIVDTDNDMIVIPVSSRGESVQHSEVSVIHAYYGSSEIPIGELSFSALEYDSEFLLASRDGNAITITTLGGKDWGKDVTKSVRVEVSHEIYGKRIASVRVSSVYAGNDSVVYSIVPSLSSIAYARDEKKQIVGENTITFRIRTTEGNNVSYLDNWEEKSMRVYVSLDSLKWDEVKNISKSYHLSASDIGTSKGLSVELWNGVRETSTARLLDMENIPLIFDGKDGTDGISIESLVNYYLADARDAGVTNEINELQPWKADINSKDAKISKERPYLWNFEEITIGKDARKTDPIIIGKYSNDGRGIDHVEEYYRLANREGNKFHPSEEGDVVPMQMTPEMCYLQNREKIIYTDNSEGTPTEWRTIGVYGDKGDTGTSVKILGHYTSKQWEEGVKEELSKTANEGDSYIVDGHLWSFVDGSFQNVGYVKGDVGEKAWVHIAYANFTNFPNGIKDFSKTDPSRREYMGIVADHTEADPDLDRGSSIGAPYKWSLIRGTYLKDVNNFYLASSQDSGVTRETVGWKEDPKLAQITEKEPFLWNYEVVKLNDGTELPTEPCIISRYAKDGVSVTGVEEVYQLTKDNDSTLLEELGWKSTAPSMTYEMRYLWNRERVCFSDTTKSKWTEPALIGVHGEKGRDGTSINIKDELGSEAELPSTGNTGDAYIINGVLYVWAGNKFKPVGEIKGPAGDSAYVHIAYANLDESFKIKLPLKENFSTTDPQGKAYIGVWCDRYAPDPDLVKQEGTPYVVGIDGKPYTWSNTKGIQGDRGPAGTSINIIDTVTVLPSKGEKVGDGYIMNGDLYLWDGTKWNPVGRINGYDGKKAWIHIAYANFYLNGTIDRDSFSTVDSDSKNYVGIAVTYTDSDAGEPTDPPLDLNDEYGKPYTWKMVRGIDGNSIRKVTNYYLAFPSGQTPTHETVGWDPNPDNVNMDKANPTLWNYEKIEYSREADTDTDPVMIAKYVEDGVSFEGIEEEYKILARGESVETDGKWIKAENFNESVSSAKPFLWNRQRPIYSDKRKVEWGKARLIGVYGDKGDMGTSVQIKGSYPTLNELKEAIKNGKEPYPGEGYGYIIDKNLYVWDGKGFIDAGEIKGPAGQNGYSTYVHVAYANFLPNGNIDSVSFSTDTPEGRTHMGLCTKTYEYGVRPTDPPLDGSVEGGPYKWRRIVGFNGADGTSINTITNYYTAKAINVEPGNDETKDEWSTKVADINDTTPYLWNMEVITYTSSSKPATRTTPHIISKYSKDGINGKGIKEIQEQYELRSRAGVVLRAWSSSPYTISASEPCLWNRERVVLEGQTLGKYDGWSAARLIGVYGEQGTEGTSIISKGNIETLPQTGNSVGDAYTCNGILYVWSYDNDGKLGWIDCGKIAGDSAYVHIAYAKYDGKIYSDFSKDNPSGRDYMGVCTDENPNDPQITNRTTGEPYKWKKIKGEDGTKGEDGAPGADAYSVQISTESINWKYEKAESTQIVVELYKGDNAVKVGVGKGKMSVSVNNPDGVNFTRSIGTTSYTFTVTKNSKAVVNAQMTFTVVSDNFTASKVVSIKTVKDGTDGGPGPTGDRGPTLRGPQRWDDLPDGYDFQDGSTGCEYKDVIYYGGSYYACKSSHSKTATNHPNGTTSKGKWSGSTSFEMIATNVLLANYQLVKNLGAEAIVMKKDGNVVFEAKDGNVTCNSGTFNGVTVSGNITATEGQIGAFTLDENGGLYNTDKTEKSYLSIIFQDSNFHHTGSFDVGSPMFGGNICTVFANNRKGIVSSCQGDDGIAIYADSSGANDSGIAIKAVSRLGNAINAHSISSGTAIAASSKSGWSIKSWGKSQIEGLHVNTMTINESTRKYTTSSDDFISLGFNSSGQTVSLHYPTGGKVMYIKNNGSSATLNGSVVRKGTTGASNVTINAGESMILVGYAGMWFEF